jgi:iron complex outermembrane receptor protein
MQGRTLTGGWVARSIALAMFLFGCLGTDAEAQTTGAVRGTVVASPGGTPIAAVDIFMPGVGRRALTDRSGRFLIPGVPAGTHEVVAERVGFGTQRQTVTVSAGGTVEVSFRMEDEAISIPEVVVIASRQAQDLSEVAASIGVIGGVEIRAAQPSHPSQIMGQVPGVWVNVTGGEGHMTAIRQPLTTNPVYLYLEDGVPTRSTGFFNHNALYEVNVPQADRIEVMKGPANALYGSDAIGGVVNVGTRAPSEDREIELALESGAYGFRRALGSASGTFGDDGIRLDLNVTGTDGWRDGTAYDRYSGTVRWDRPLGRDGSLKSVVTYSNIDQNTAGSSAISRDDFESNPTVNYTPISFRKVTAFRASTAYERHASDWSLSLTPYARHNSMDLLPNWSLTYDPSVWYSSNSSVGMLTKLGWEPSGRSRVIAGVDMEYSPGSYREVAIAPTREGAIFTQYQPGETIYDYSVAFRQLSPYVHGEFTPGDRVHVSAGLRFDLLGYSYESALTTLQTGQHRRPANASPSFDAVSPKIGVTFAATDELDLFGSYRRGFRAPSEGQLFRQGSAVNTVDLLPVKANSLEAGLRGRVGGRVRYEVSVYHMTKTDDILSYRYPDGSTESVNAGETLHKGVEVGVGVQLTRGLGIDVSYSIAEHTYEDWKPQEDADLGGNEMEFAPKQIGSARLEIAPPSLSSLRATLEWSRIGPYWMDAENVSEYEGHNLMNVRASWAFAERFELFGRVDNVTDERYAERASYNAFRGEELAPGMPRTLYMGLRVR